VLIRALGIGTNQQILDLFGEEPKILASFSKDPSENYQDGLLELYKKLRPGEPLSVDSAESLINGMFFDPRRYDLAKVGRYKFNKKLALKNRVVGFRLAEDVVDTTTGEVIAEADTEITEEIADKIQNAAIPYFMIQTEERNCRILTNFMVDLNAYVDCDAAAIMGLGKREALLIAGGQQGLLSPLPAMPDRTHRVNDVPGRKIIARCDDRVARPAAADGAARLDKLRPGGLMNGGVQATARNQVPVRRVDDCVNPHFCHVVSDDFKWHCRLLCRWRK